MKLVEQNISYLNERFGLALSVNHTLSDLQHGIEGLEISMEDLLIYNLVASQLPWDQIAFVFLDVDGVMTEGGMHYTETGDEFKRFDTKDGMAIKHAMKSGIQFGIISSGINEAIIRHRADMFGINHVYVGTRPKLEVAETWLKSLKLTWDQCAYIGDDINDLAMFEKCNVSAAPADASIPNKRAASFVLQSNGGHGCIREFLRYHPILKNTL